MSCDRHGVTSVVLPSSPRRVGQLGRPQPRPWAHRHSTGRLHSHGRCDEPRLFRDPRARLSTCILCAVCAVGGNQLHGASRGLPQDCGPCGRRACCAAWCCRGGCGRQRRGGVDQSWARPLGLGSAMPRSSLLDSTEAAVTAGGVLCTQVTLARRREPWRVDLCAGVSVQPSVSLHVSWGCGRLPRAKATTGPARSRGLGNTVGGLTSQTACVRLYKAQARRTGQERQPGSLKLWSAQ